jgi:glycerol transport system ATP-binding protein
MNLFAARRNEIGFALQGGITVARHLPPSTGSDLTAGLRAGALDVTPRPGHIGLDGVVKLAEISGSDTFVHARTAAGDVVAQLPGVHRYTLDQPLTLYFDPAQTYAFGADGALLAAPARRAATGGGA